MLCFHISQTRGHFPDTIQILGSCIQILQHGWFSSLWLPKDFPSCYLDLLSEFTFTEGSCVLSFELSSQWDLFFNCVSYTGGVTKLVKAVVRNISCCLFMVHSPGCWLIVASCFYNAFPIVYSIGGNLLRGLSLP